MFRAPWVTKSVSFRFLSQLQLNDFFKGSEGKFTALFIDDIQLSANWSAMTSLSEYNCPMSEESDSYYVQKRLNAS